MPLQHTQPEERAVPLITTTPTQAAELSLVPTPPIALSQVPLVQDAPRYDAATVQHIIVLAQQMQTRHRETMTPEQVEALGHEVGVEPEFVRRALAQVEARAEPGSQAAGKHTKRVTEISCRPLSRRQRALAVVPATLFLLLALLLFGQTSTVGNLGILLYVVLPAVLTLCAAVKGNSKRIGMLSGSLFGLASAIAFITEFLRAYGNSSEGYSLNNVVDSFFPMVLIFFASGLAIGGMGAALGQGVRTLRRKRLRVRLVVETNESK